ncbi:MAG TPA: NUDIX domain-containing protein [Burkholderiales bacterium]|nr:NUDIX domain-containing protein [Burkholderiales bacterium]
MRTKILSAGLVIVQRGSCRYLLLRAYNYWDFPKGEVDPGEAPMQAALREAEEETSLKALVFTWGDVFRQTEPYGRGKVARYYLAETGEARVTLIKSATLGRPEHHEYRWLRYEEARPRLVPRLVLVLDWAHEVTGC